MEDKPIFSSKELTRLPFNYQYIKLVQTNNKNKTDLGFDPIRTFSIKALNESAYICSHPEKPISKLCKPIVNDEP